MKISVRRIVFIASLVLISLLAYTQLTLERGVSVPLPNFVWLHRTSGGIICPDVAPIPPQVISMWCDNNLILFKIRPDAYHIKNFGGGWPSPPLKDEVYYLLHPTDNTIYIYDTEDKLRNALKLHNVSINEIKLRNIYEQRRIMKNLWGVELNGKNVQKIKRAQEDMISIARLIGDFRRENKKLPQSLRDLDSVAGKGEDVPTVDPWGNNYEYKKDNKGYTLSSKGAKSGFDIFLPEKFMDDYSSHYEVKIVN